MAVKIEFRNIFPFRCLNSYDLEEIRGNQLRNFAFNELRYEGIGLIFTTFPLQYGIDRNGILRNIGLITNGTV